MRKYTKEFKQQAVDLAVSLNNVVEAGKQLGIPDANIYAWKSKLLKKENLVNKPGLQKTQSNESEELTRLRRENAELKKVNHILKGAAAFFSQDHLK